MGVGSWFLGVVAALSASACVSEREYPSAIVVGMTNSAVNLDPRIGADEASQKAHQLLYNTLLRIDDSLRIVPELAESIEHPDDLTYVVTLRRGVLFHNGRELTAEDVAYTFRSFLDPTFGGRSGAYRIVQAVDIVDPYRVSFRLKEPFGSFPINLVMGVVQAGSGGANVRTPIGTGPYTMVSFKPDDRIVLARFDQYFGGPAKNTGVVLKVVPDDTMRGLELRKGAVDLVVNDVAPDIVWQMQREGKLKIETAPGSDYAYIGLNLRDPLLERTEVRKAIGYAVDRHAIVTYLRRGFASPAVGIVPPMSWAFEREVFDFRYDPAESKRLLDAAGFPDPDGDGPRPRFALTLKTSTSEMYRMQAAAIQQDLSRVGIAVDVRSQEFATLLSEVAESRPVLTGILVRFDGPTLVMAATDSYRLSVKETSLSSPGPDLEAIIPARALSELGRLVGEGTVRLGVSENHVVFGAGDSWLTTRRIDGQFPNYKQLLPESFEVELALPRTELLGIVRRAAVVAQRNTPLRLRFADGELTISSQSQDYGETSESLPAPYTGDPLEIGFNADFLREGLESIAADTVTVQLINPLRPGLLTDPEDAFWYLIMPIRLAG